MAAIVQQPSRIGWRFWIYWMLATIASAAVFIIAMLPVNVIMTAARQQAAAVAPGGTERWIALTAAAVVAALMGAFFGSGQWLVLRRCLPRSGWWVIATIVGYSVPLSFGMSFVSGPPPLGPVIMGLEFGLGLGVLQWLVLRTRVYQAGWWVLISLAGWALAFALTGAFYLSGLYIEPMDMLFAFLVPVAVAGAGLVWLLRRTAEAGRTLGS